MNTNWPKISVVMAALLAIGLISVPAFADDPTAPVTPPAAAPDPGAPPPAPPASDEDPTDPSYKQKIKELEAEIATGHEQLNGQLKEKANAVARAKIAELTKERDALKAQLADPNAPVDVTLTDPALTTEASALEAEVTSLKAQLLAKRKELANAVARAKIAELTKERDALRAKLAPPTPPAPPATPAPAPAPAVQPSPAPAPTPAPAGPKTTPGTYNK